MPTCQQNYSSLGNFLVIPNAAALPVGSERYSGRLVYQADTERLWVWSGVAWHGMRSKAFGPGTPTAVTTSAAVESTACSLLIPNQGVPGKVIFWGHLYGVKSTAGDSFYGKLYSATVDLEYQARPGFSTDTSAMFNMQGQATQAAGSSLALHTAVVRSAGSGTLTTSGNRAYNRIDAIHIPYWWA